MFQSDSSSVNTEAYVNK